MRDIHFLIIIVCLTLGLGIGSAVAFACHDPDPPWPPIGIDTGGELVLSGTVEIKATLGEDAKFESVEFFANDESIGKDDEAPYSIKWDTTTVENGEYKLTTVGTTSEGEEVKSEIVTVTVENPKDS